MLSALNSYELFLTNHGRKCTPWTGAVQGQRLAASPAGVSVCADPRYPLAASTFTPLGGRGEQFPAFCFLPVVKLRLSNNVLLFAG